jgi:UrcA family protein
MSRGAQLLIEEGVQAVYRLRLAPPRSSQESRNVSHVDASAGPPRCGRAKILTSHTGRWRFFGGQSVLIHETAATAVHVQSPTHTTLQSGANIMSLAKLSGALRHATVAVALAGSLFATAHAGSPALSEPQQVVRYGDLNLNSSAGIAALFHRVHQAAEQVCGGEVDRRELERAARWEACVNQATERAVDSINVPALTQYYRNRDASPSARIA